MVYYAMDMRTGVAWVCKRHIKKLGSDWCVRHTFADVRSAYTMVLDPLSGLECLQLADGAREGVVPVTLFADAADIVADALAGTIWEARDANAYLMETRLKIKIADEEESQLLTDVEIIALTQRYQRVRVAGVQRMAKQRPPADTATPGPVVEAVTIVEEPEEKKEVTEADLSDAAYPPPPKDLFVVRHYETCVDYNTTEFDQTLGFETSQLAIAEGGELLYQDESASAGPQSRVRLQNGVVAMDWMGVDEVGHLTRDEQLAHGALRGECGLIQSDEDFRERLAATAGPAEALDYLLSQGASWEVITKAWQAIVWTDLRYKDFYADVSDIDGPEGRHATEAILHPPFLHVPDCAECRDHGKSGDAPALVRTFIPSFKYWFVREGGSDDCHALDHVLWGTLHDHGQLIYRAVRDLKWSKPELRRLHGYRGWCLRVLAAPDLRCLPVAAELLQECELARDDLRENLFELGRRARDWWDARHALPEPETFFVVPAGLEHGKAKWKEQLVGSRKVRLKLSMQPAELGWSFRPWTVTQGRYAIGGVLKSRDN